MWNDTSKREWIPYAPKPEGDFGQRNLVKTIIFHNLGKERSRDSKQKLGTQTKTNLQQLCKDNLVKMK